MDNTTLTDNLDATHQQTIAKQPIHAKFRLGMLPPISPAAREPSLSLGSAIAQHWNDSPVHLEEIGRSYISKYINFDCSSDLFQIICCACKNEIVVD